MGNISTFPALVTTKLIYEQMCIKEAVVDCEEVQLGLRKVIARMMEKAFEEGMTGKAKRKLEEV